MEDRSPLVHVRVKCELESRMNEQLLEDRLAGLEKTRAWSPRLVSKLEHHIRSADDEGLFRINAMTFAREKHVSEQDAIDVFLHATALGIFTTDWVLFCPKCCCVVESLRSLRGVRNAYRCSFCQVGYDAALDEYIAVTFTVSPDIRQISFHHPETLPAWDHFFKARNTSDGVLPDGTTLANAKAAIAKAVSYLPPRGITRLEIEVSEGTILCGSPEGKVAMLLPIVAAATERTPVVRVRYGTNAVTAFTTGEVAAGTVTFEVENATSEQGMIVIAVLPPGFDPETLPVRFVPFLNGKRLLTSQTFRDLFRSEVIQASEGISVREITLLFTDLKGSTALYDRIGDLNAFALVQRHFERVLDVVVRHRGVIVKTIGDAVMAAFMTAHDAAAAALEMRKEIAAFNSGQTGRELLLKIGVHSGASIAVTLNERLDYFGQTVNIAARIQNLADGDEICMSEDVYQSSEVARLLDTCRVDSSVVSLKGVRDDLRIYRVAAG